MSALFAVAQNNIPTPPAFGRLPSSSIQITRIDFPFLQQKILNSIVYAVTTGIAKKVRADSKHAIAKTLANMGLVDWCVESSTLRKLSHFRSNNYDAFNDAINGLSGRVVDYNILAKDKERTLVCPECQTYMLQDDPIGSDQTLVCPECQTKVTKKESDLLSTVYASSVIFDTIAIHQNVVYFSFGRLMSYFLEKAKKRFYCKFLPDVANALNRGPSHAIYLLLLDYMDEKRGAGQLPFIDIKTFAKLTGGEKYTKNFKDLRVNVIEPSVKEITELTNIDAVFDQEYDTKKDGRKITSLRIRAMLKTATQLQLPGLDDEKSVLGVQINIEEFLDFLSRNAKEKIAYKNTMRKALQNNTIEDLSKRLDDFLAYKAKEDEKNLFAMLDQIARESKKEQIENLYIRDTAGNFLSFSALIGNGRFYEVAKQIAYKPKEEISALLYTEQAKYAQDIDDAEQYDKTIIPALSSIAALKEWKIITGDHEFTLAYPMGNLKYPLLPIRKAIFEIKAGNTVLFRALGNSYRGVMNGVSLELIPIDKETR